MNILEIFRQKRDVNQLAKPESWVQEIIYQLIKGYTIDMFSMSYPKLSTRISELSKDINISKFTSVKYSKYGNKYQYTRYFIKNNEIVKAIRIYKKLTK